MFVFEQSENLGLANSIIQGVTKIINQTGRVIVLEDDVEVSPYFLQYMNDALIVYENNLKVNGIGSWNFFSNKSSTPDTFFVQFQTLLAGLLGVIGGLHLKMTVIFY